MVIRAVQVITEVGALDRPLDYLVPEEWPDVTVGERVRAPLQSRSVRGWVVGPTSPQPSLRPLRTRLDVALSPEVVALAQWAAQRWVAPVARFLQAASPGRLVRSLPEAPAAFVPPSLGDVAWNAPPGIVQVGPTDDVLGIVAQAIGHGATAGGSVVVVVPGEGWAGRLRTRLERRGVAVAADDDVERVRAGWPVVVGTRSAVWASVPRLAAVVVIDGEDEALRSSAWPRWDAVTVARERARRAGVPAWITTVVPSPVLRAGVTSTRATPGSWPAVRIVDRRSGDPHDGWLAAETVSAAHRALAGDEDVAVAVLLQRLGAGRLLACGRCGELYRCGVCGGAERDSGDLVACADGHEPRPPYCRACGSTQVRRRRVGVQGLASAVAAQLSQPVSVVTAGTSEPFERVVVGTEALWGRVRRAGLVVVADFDQYLLAPRAAARHEALRAVARAGRVVGGRTEGRGLVVIQTRRGEDAVVEALRRGDLTTVLDEEDATARELGLAPYGATATVSGPGAEDVVDAVTAPARAWSGEGRWTVWAPDEVSLRAVLASAPHPAGLRLDVD